MSEVAHKPESQPERAFGELRLRNRALIEMARSEAIAHGDLVTAFRQITETAARLLQVERVGIWCFDEARTRIVCTDLYEATPQRHSSGLELHATDYPSYFRAIVEDRALAADDARGDPRTSEFRESYLEPFGITSLLDAPVVFGKRTIGIICHEHVGPPRHWSSEEQDIAGAMTDFVAMAMQARDRGAAEERVRQSDERLTAVQRLVGLGSWDWDLGSGQMMWSGELYRLLGVEPGTIEPSCEAMADRVFAAERDGFLDRVRTALTVGGHFELQFRIELPGGGIRFLECHGEVVTSANGEPQRMAGTVLDVSARARAVILRETRTDAFEKLARGEGLNSVLETMVLGLERLSPRMLCSVLLLDRQGRLHLGAAPSLPTFYNQAIEGLNIGPGVGSCGTAAATGELVIVEDIATHPYWTIARDIAAAADLRACWSQPIRSSVGEILGTFAIYYREPRAPTDFDLEAITAIADAAGVAIELSLAESRRTLLMQELDHRVKNNLATVLSIAQQTAAGSDSLDSFLAAFTGRVRSMAIVHELLARKHWEGAGLREMVARILDPYEGDDRIRIEGEDLVLPMRVAPLLCLVLQELATNAARHGALSVGAGNVRVRWRIELPRPPAGDPTLHVEWSEHDGPEVAEPQRRGFGTQLIRDMIAYQLGGDGQLTYDRTGLRCSLTVPLIA